MWKSSDCIAAVNFKNALIFKFYFLRGAHGAEQTPFTRRFPFGTHVSAEAMRNKCFAQGHNILMQAGFEPSIVVSRNRHLTHMTYMFVLLGTA